MAQRPASAIRDRQALLERAVVAVELLAEGRAPSSSPLPLVIAQPESMLVRHLGLAHLGRWIHFPGRPAKRGPRYAQEPSLT